MATFVFRVHNAAAIAATSVESKYLSSDLMMQEQIFAPVCTGETWATDIERWNKLFRAVSCVKAWARDHSASEAMFYNYAQM